MSKSQIPNLKSEISFRPARQTDMPAVLELIKELAHYERAPQEVTVTVDDLVYDGFTAKLFTCIVAEMDGEIVGMALFYPRYSTWKGRTIHLEDFIVKQDYRKHGIGKLLFDETVKAAKDFGSKRLEWLVLEWNEPALNFYRKIGATMDAEWHIGKLTEEQLKNFEF
jgi:GNAT superfamily N-acetyltransferase